DYGNIVSLWFGSRLAVVISSPSAFQECFTKHDIALANRLPSLSGKYIFYGNTTVGSCSHGEHWRNLRRITSLDVLSTQRVHSFSGIRSDETKRLIQRLARNSRVEFAHVEMTSMFHDLTYNNIMRMISGKRFYGEESDIKDVKEAKEFRETVAKMLELMGLSNKADYLPFLRWFDFQSVEKRLKNISNRYDAILNKIIHENRSKKQRENSMIDHLLKLQETQPEYYTDQIIKGLALVSP
ncbi:isoflavone 2'-hydroxylase-like, partial [Cajanus cajan]|uniref:isoflavone 2'-hydroxylase-like n=1 Tax=Cajanus cajan TaxID=3821 RepID=UPI0010FB5E56